jgi:hypothetical protein
MFYIHASYWIWCGVLPNVSVGFTADILLSWLCLVLLGVASKLMGSSGISEHMHCLFQSNYGSHSFIRLRIDLDVHPS